MPSDSPETLVELLDPQERERPTLKTIARIAGLAVPTVSRALSNAPDISDDTKERVRRIADALGYRPNRAGLRLRTGKTNVIALVLSTDHDVMNHTARLIGSLAGELRGTPYHLIVLPYFPDESPMTPIEYIVRTGSADGIIMNRIEPDDPRIRYLRARKFPFAMHGRTNDCAGDPWFDYDNEAYGLFALEALARRGRRNVLMVAPPMRQAYAQHMWHGASAAASRMGVTLTRLETATSDSPSVDITTAVARHLATQPPIDGMITASAPAAMAATIALEDAGHVLGDTLDLASKEAIPLLKAFRRAIVVMNEDVTYAGRFLAQAVIQAIDHPDLTPMQYLDRPEPDTFA